MANTISMGDRRHWHNRVLRPFDKFVQWKLPFPLDPMEDIYRSYFTDKDWAAIRYLQETHPLAIKADSSFDLFWTEDRAHYNHPHVTFRFPEGEKWPEVPVMIDKLPEHVQGILRSWITSVNQLRSLREEISCRAQGLVGNASGDPKSSFLERRRRANLDPCCNSPAQLYTIWPEAHPFFPRAWRDAVRLSSMRSRLPPRVGYKVHRDGQTYWATPEQFRCEDTYCSPAEKKRFEKINNILLMVSLAKDVPEVKNYPHVYGDHSLHACKL